MRAIAVAYVANFVVGTVLSWRHDIPARPFGLGTGWGVRRDIVLGFGCGLAAPWPMIAFLPFARSERERFALSLMFLVGALSEPITHRALAGEVPRAETVVAGANIALPALGVVAWRFWRGAGS